MAPLLMTHCKPTHTKPTHSQPTPRRLTTHRLTPLERALLRLLVTGYDLHEATRLLGLPLPEAEGVVQDLQRRVDVPCLTRLLTVAVLNRWV